MCVERRRECVRVWRERKCVWRERVCVGRGGGEWVGGRESVCVVLTSYTTMCSYLCCRMILIAMILINMSSLYIAIVVTVDTKYKNSLRQK